MNYLTKKAPTSVEINGVTYKLNTNFRECIRTVQAYEDDSLSLHEKAQVLLINLYSQNGILPPTLHGNYEEALIKGVEFLDGDTPTNTDVVKRKVYSFNDDSSYIASALLSKNNGVDVSQVDYMHWHTFLLHFSEVGDSTFSNIVGLRIKYLNGTLDKEDIKQCEEIGWHIIKLKQPENKERDEIKELLMGGD